MTKDIILKEENREITDKEFDINIEQIKKDAEKKGIKVEFANGYLKFSDKHRDIDIMLSFKSLCVICGTLISLAVIKVIYDVYIQKKIIRKK